MAEEKDIILVLFSTLKEAINDMNSTCKDLLNNQKTIATYMEGLPIKELRDSLKEHNKESADNIGECTETVNEQTNSILDVVSDLSIKVKLMIATVAIAFTLTSAAWFYTNFFKVPTVTDKRLETTIIELKKTIEEDRDKSSKEIEENKKIIEELRNTIKHLHDSNPRN